MDYFKFHPAQSLLASDLHRFRVARCGRRFGKTVLSAWEMFGVAVAKPEARVPYYAPTRDDARDIMWGMIQKICEPLIVDKNEARLEIKIKNNCGGTSDIILYGWEAVQERKKGVGVKNDFIVLDEVSKYRNFQEGWQEVLRPTLTDTKGGALFISTPNGFNHFYDLSELEKTDRDYKSFHFTSFDNPYLDPKELIKAKGEMSEDRFAQEYLADFRKTEGLVYKEFNRKMHLFDELPQIQFVETIAGCDFGFNHPAAVPTIRKDYDGRYWITEEFYHTHHTDQQIAEYVASKQFNKVYPDPENAGGIQELKNHGVNVREVIKGKGSVKNGISVVRELLRGGQLRIKSTCVNTIREFETYSYPPKEERRDDENPIKENDDMMDAIRYALMMDYQGRYKSEEATVTYNDI